MREQKSSRDPRNVLLPNPALPPSPKRTSRSNKIESSPGRALHHHPAAKGDLSRASVYWRRKRLFPARSDVDTEAPGFRNARLLTSELSGSFIHLSI